MKVALTKVADPEKKKGQKQEPLDPNRARYLLLGLGEPVHLGRLLPGGGHKAYKQQRKDGIRTFAMWTDLHRKNLWAQCRTVGLPGDDAATYEVLGAEGERVGRITREGPFTGFHARARWTVEPAGSEPAVGYKGRWFWWIVWWLIFPVQCVIAVLSICGDGDVFRTPRRIGFRRDGARVIDYGSSFESGHLSSESDDWDPRLLAALVALQHSHDGILGEAWDKTEGA